VASRVRLDMLDKKEKSFPQPGVELRSRSRLARVLVIIMTDLSQLLLVAKAHLQNKIST
jgi:hypothetical protein